MYLPGAVPLHLPEGPSGPGLLYSELSLHIRKLSLTSIATMPWTPLSGYGIRPLLAIVALAPLSLSKRGRRGRTESQWPLPPSVFLPSPGRSEPQAGKLLLPPILQGVSLAVVLQALVYSLLSFSI